MTASPLPLEIRGRPVAIALLAQQVGAIDQLALLMEASWPDWYGEQGHSARRDLEDRCRTTGLPLGLVALWDGEAVGTCALVETSGGLKRAMDNKPLPWLGGLLVRPDLRRRGIGAALLGAARQIAGRDGHSRLLALTAIADSLFVASGWTLSQDLWLEGTAHRIYIASTQPDTGLQMR